MEDETSSYIVWCWRDPQSDSARVRVVRVDTGEVVPLTDGSFLLRVFVVKGKSGVRCFVRHIASNQSVYLQSGSALRDFVRDHVLESDKPPPAADSKPPEA
jgi:hypothetical protein